LAHDIEALGHTVAVIDQEAAAFRRLGEGFAGTTIVGVGFDREVLESAGIDQAQAFAAVSSGDNSNIVAARVARETYRVPTVVARIYDPGRAAVYQRLGIPTVATVSWTTDQILRRILPSGAAEDWRDPSGRVTLAEISYHTSWVGTEWSDIETASGVRVAIVTRLGEGLMPQRGGVLQDGDVVHVVAMSETLPRAVAILSAQRVLP
jgi:trk system potassium uptake protein TrkA